MASNYQEFVTKVQLNAEDAKKQLDILSNKAKDLRKQRDEAAKAGDRKAMEKYAQEIAGLEKQMKQYRVTSQNVAHTLKNLSEATLSDLKKAQRELNREMQNTPRNTEYYRELQKALDDVKREMKGVKEEAKEAGESAGRMGRFFQETFSNYAAYALHDIQELAGAFISNIRQMVTESTDLAKSAEGVKLAFDRINQPGLLDNLRQATHGTVSDLELMTQAVKFKDLNLPVNQLGTYLAFAQQKAKDTGESIDYLVNSIVTGLGRQSPMILDNLGLSAKQISDEAKKSGDFFWAVAKIVEQNMAQAGEYVETAAERSVQASVRLQNEQEKLGEALLPLREKIDAAYGEMQLKALQAVRWLYENRKEVAEVVKAFARFAVEGAVIVGVWNAMTIATKAHTLALTINQAMHRGWVVVAGTARTVMIAMQLAWTLCTKGVQAYTVALQAAKVASLTNPWTALATVLLTVGVAVYELVSHFNKETDAAKKAKTATDEFVQMQRTMKSVNEEANRSIAQEKTRFEQLRKTLEDNKRSMKDRLDALEQIRKVCPEYHGQLTTEGRLISHNTEALDAYITNLIKAARAQAAFNKMVQIQENSLGHEQLLQQRQGNLNYARNRLRKMGASESSTFTYAPGSVDANDGWAQYDSQGKFVRYVTGEQMKQIQQMQKLVQYNKTRINQEQTILDANQRTSDVLQKMVRENGGYTPPSPGVTPTTPTTTDTKKSKGNTTTNKGDDERKKKMREELEDQRALNDALQAMNMSRYYQGEITYREYMAKQKELTVHGLDEQIAIYKKYNENYLQLSDDRAKALMDQQDQEGRFKLTDLQRQFQLEQVQLQAQFNDRNSAIYHNEDVLDEALFQLEMDFLRKKADIQREGSEERAATEHEITLREAEHRLDRQLYYEEQLQSYRKQYGQLGNEEQLQLAMQGLEKLKKEGLLKVEEYERMKMAIQAQYAKSPVQQRNEQFDANVNDAVATAKANASGGYDKSQAFSMSNNPLVGQIQQYSSTMEQLKVLYEQDKITYAEYQTAKGQVTSEFLNNMVAGFQAAYDSLNNVMSAASSYYAAQSQYEQNVTSKKYDKMIEKAGNNQKKQKKLEEKKQKELAKIKNKYNKKQAKIQIAQAIAQTAISAINAYSSAAVIPVVGHVLAPIAAAMAVAAGMLQVATIKKQAAAQEEGYYSGGFTGGNRYRRVAGNVHEGEFVVNHDGVNNDSLMPVLRLIDRAQQNNTIGTLTAADVTRQLGQGRSQLVAPIVNVQNDNEELRDAIGQMNEGIDRLNFNLENPTPNPISVEEIDRKLDIFHKYKKNT